MKWSKLEREELTRVLAFWVNSSNARQVYSYTVRMFVLIKVPRRPHYSAIAVAMFKIRHAALGCRSPR